MWDRAEAVAKGNNRFLFIAWSALPLTLREPLHLQDVLPAGQRQVAPRVGGTQSFSWCREVLCLIAGKGSLHQSLSLVTRGRNSTVISWKTAFVYNSRGGRVCRAGIGNIFVLSASVGRKTNSFSYTRAFPGVWKGLHVHALCNCLGLANVP